MKIKGIETQRVDLPNPSQAIDAPIGDEEEKGKQKEKREKQGAGPQPSNIQSPPTKRRYHMVTLFFLLPRPTGESYISSTQPIYIVSHSYTRQELATPPVTTEAKKK